jgi:site-specific recombinase XerD
MGLQEYLISNGSVASGTRQTFGKVAAQVVELERSRVFAGEVAKMSVRNFEYRLNSMILPAFGERVITEITGEQIHLLYQRLIAKGLASISVAQYLQDLKKIFNYAYAHGLVDRIPYFPKVKKTSIPRGGFTVREYRQLVVAAKQLSMIEKNQQGVTHRNTAGGVYTKTDGIPPEIVWVIRFMVNGFMRPSDIFHIKHKHVEIVRREYEYLRLTLPETKRHKNQIVTLRPAVKVYERLKAYMASRNLAGPNDYLFLPEIKDRAIAGRLISQHFNKVLNAAEMKQGTLGQQRSLYSLRHTSIMFRLLYGNGIDLLTLARNARTSVQMIEKFYASNLTSEMNIGLIQSRRSMH